MRSIAGLFFTYTRVVNGNSETDKVERSDALFYVCETNVMKRSVTVL